jgi:hypothetical protein
MRGIPRSFLRSSMGPLDLLTNISRSQQKRVLACRRQPHCQAGGAVVGWLG